MGDVSVNSALEESAKYSGDPWTPQNPYFERAEASMGSLWNNLIWPMIADCRFDRVIDLAAGHGRNTVMLLAHASHVYPMDIQSGNIEVIKARFLTDSRVEPLVCNGYDLQPVEDEHCTLVYSFDAMVHFNPDVVGSYLKDTARVLVAGGHGFFHHSNYSDGMDWRTNPGSRNFMTPGLFGDLAEKAGLSVVSQKVIDWGPRPKLDAVTLVSKN
jgi:SAM-dependent methyltransferase